MTEVSIKQYAPVPLDLAHGLAIAAKRTPNKTAVTQGDRAFTYREVNDRTNKIGHALRALGLTEGDRVGVVLANVPEFVELCFGISRAGFAIVPVSYRLVGPEIAFQLNDSGARALFYSTNYAQAIADARATITGVEKYVAIGESPAAGDLVYEDLLAAASSDDSSVWIGEESPFCIYYTSGTTGVPKGAIVSHRSRTLTMFAMASEYGCYSQDDRSLGTAPIYHGAGMVFCLATVYFGGTLSLMERFNPEELLMRLSTERLSNVFMVPTMFHAVFGLPEAIRNKYDLPALTHWLSNAAALPQATKELILNAWPHTKLFELYGSTEGEIVTSLRPEDQLRKIQCVGHPFPLTDVKLLDEEGNEVGPNEVGELFSRSPYVFNGYLGMPQATADGFNGGYFSAGDLAKRDDEGYIYIVDRKKDLIISGGTNIYPREIEEILFRHPKVADVAVIGVPDDYWGEAIKAIVVAKPGMEVSEAEILAFCEDKVAKYKLPRSVAFIDELPRNPAAKVLKRDLRERFKT